jgi:hypothetical protein
MNYWLPRCRFRVVGAADLEPLVHWRFRLDAVVSADAYETPAGDDHQLRRTGPL